MFDLGEDSYEWALLRALDFVEERKTKRALRGLVYLIAYRYHEGVFPVMDEGWSNLSHPDKLSAQISTTMGEPDRRRMTEAEKTLLLKNLVSTDDPLSTEDDVLGLEVNLTKRGDMYIDERLRRYGPVGMAEERRWRWSVRIAICAGLIALASLFVDAFQSRAEIRNWLGTVSAQEASLQSTGPPLSH